MMLPHMTDETEGLDWTGWPDVHLEKSLCGGECCHSVLHLASDTVFTIIVSIANVEPLYEVLSVPYGDVSKRERHPTILQYVHKDYPRRYNFLNLLEAKWDASDSFGTYRINTNFNVWYLLKCAHKSKKEVQWCISGEVAVVKIQKAYRLWVWRKTNIFDPNSRLGKLNLLIKATKQKL